MNEQEILQQYKSEINDNIQRYYQEYNITSDTDKEIFAKKYQYNFVKGFNQGVEESVKKIANNMLKSNLEMKFIASVTGLSIDTLQKLKSSL